MSQRITQYAYYDSPAVEPTAVSRATRFLLLQKMRDAVEAFAAKPPWTEKTYTTCGIGSFSTPLRRDEAAAWLKNTTGVVAAKIFWTGPEQEAWKPIAPLWLCCREPVEVNAHEPEEVYAWAVGEREEGVPF